MTGGLAFGGDDKRDDWVDYRLTVDKIRPNGISFSLFLAIAAKHYIDTHNEPIDVYGEVPNYYSNIESWKSEIKNMSAEEFIRLQKRHVQLGNLIKREVLRKI